MLRVLDLFSGIGGFSLGLERTGGFQTVAFCEIEPFCRKILAKHWPGVPIYEDVRELTGARLAADGIAVDVICGGFPCTDLSAAGGQAGLEGDTRSGLVWEYVRLLGELRPKFALIENVANFRRGADLAAECSVHCLCGWSCRWRGVPDPDGEDERGMRQTQLLVSALGGDGGQGESPPDNGSFATRRDAPDPGLEEPRASGSRCLERSHERSAANTRGDLSAPDREAGAMPPSNSGLQTAGGEADWLRPDSRRSAGDDLGSQSHRAGREDAWWLVCPSCGREMDHAARQPLRTSWFGSVQRAVAAVGYDAEWYSVSASAVGAPHARERVWVVAYPGSAGFQGIHEPRGRERLQSTAEALRGRWAPEPSVARVADGVPRRLVRDPISALGNSLLPQIPELIGEAILEAEAQMTEAA